MQSIILIQSTFEAEARFDSCEIGRYKLEMSSYRGAV